MSEKQLITAMGDLQAAIYSLKESIDSLTAIQRDIFNENPHDMMRELNGSLQEIVKELERRPIK